MTIRSLCRSDAMRRISFHGVPWVTTPSAAVFGVGSRYSVFQTSAERFLTFPEVANRHPLLGDNGVRLVHGALEFVQTP